MVVKKPALKKKRKIKKKKPITTQKQTQKQVVNVYLNKLNRQRKVRQVRQTAPKRIIPSIQPQVMYNGGTDLNNMILGLSRQNNTLMGIIDKQRKTDTTPNSDINSLDEVVGKKSKLTDIDGKNIVGLEEMEDFEDLNKPKNVIIDTSSRGDVSDMLSSIAQGMDEIPQGQGIKKSIMEIGDRIRPKTDEKMITLDELDELGQLEIKYSNLVEQLREQRKKDSSITMSKYNTLPVKVSTLKNKIADMTTTLQTSRRLTRFTPIGNFPI